ncbi:MAG: CDGSH iron-sulfur domain-containing protein [Bacteroidetes bacterium]|nr:CDGSH iron-sulfur domain-containing protein [Bacteroidota bacterium]
MPTKITVNANGPFMIEGDFTLTDGAQNSYDLAGREKIFLCRCGESSNKPFCDGAHKSCGFVDPGEARALAPKQ